MQEILREMLEEPLNSQAKNALVLLFTLEYPSRVNNNTFKSNMQVTTGIPAFQSKQLVGRLTEQSILQELLESHQAEFLAIYGRRRIGKTFLVREYFKDKDVIFF